MPEHPWPTKEQKARRRANAEKRVATGDQNPNGGGRGREPLTPLQKILLVNGGAAHFLRKSSPISSGPKRRYSRVEKKGFEV